MGKSKDLGHLAHIVAYNAENHITVPAGITMHTNQLVASQDWVTTALGSYALSSSLSSYAPTSRTITINGTTYDLSANRSWDITSMIYPAAGIALSTGSAWGTSITNNSANWNTAYGWGNHASAGYLTGITSTQVTNALGFTPYNSTNPAGYITGISFTNVSAKPTTLSGYGITDAVPSARTITINGTTWDLSANRSFTVTATETDTLATVTSRGASTSTPVVFSGNMAAWNATTPGLGLGTIQIGAANGTANAGGAITFAARDGGGGSNAQAGIYIVSDGNYGTRMYFATTDAYVTGSKTAMSISETGVVNFVRANATVQGNALIHTGNIGSQSVNYATSSGSSSSVSGLTLTNSSNGINPDSVTQNQIGYDTSVSLFGQGDGGLYSSAYNSSWIHQIHGDFRTGQMAIRGKNNGSWTGWRTVIDSGSIGSQSVSYASSAGNSSTVGGISESRIVYGDGPRASISSSNINDPNQKSGFYFYYDPTGRPYQEWWNWMTIAGNSWQSSNNYSFQFAHSFHNDDLYVRRMTNGGAAGWRYILTDANYNSYAPTKTGGGASGTWRISITGSAGSLASNASASNIYNSGWFRNYGDSGLYNQDYGCHLVRNNESSHGAWSIFGYTKAGYIGMNLRDPQTYNNNLMYENGNGGMYTENANGWQWYYNRGSNCLGLGGSTTYNWVRAVVNGKLKIESDSIHTGWAYFDSNTQLAGGGNTLYNEYNYWYVWRNWGGWGGEWINRNGGDMIMNLYAVYAVTGSVSDIRYKKEVTPVTYGLNEIMRLNPIKYKYNMPKESMLANDPDFFLGFSAQEVQGIIPEAVHEKMDSNNKDGMLAITYDELIPVLVNGIKEQQVMIHNQNIKINKLESLVNQLLNN